MAKQMKQMTDDELVTICMEEIARGIGGGLDAENDNDISLPLDYYLGKLPGISAVTAKDKNASRYVSMDVMDGIEATVAEIMPTFSTDSIGFYVPSGEGDEEQAETESALVNYLFFEEYNGWTLLQELLKDALLHRNCTAKAYWDERAEVVYEEYANVNQMALQQILQPNAPMQEVEVVEQVVDGEEEMEAVEPTEERQTLVRMGLAPDLAAPIEETFNIKIKRTTIVGRPVIKSLAPEEVIVNGDHNSPFLDDARVACHEKSETSSSLIAQGFDPEIVAMLPDYSNNTESLSRSRGSEEFDYASSHESTTTKRVYECYILVDFDGDGIAERRKVVIGDGGHLLANDPVTSVSLVGGVTTLMPHKYKGISLFERLREIQDTKTPLIRAVVDATQLAANPRLGVIVGAVNIDDLLTSRTGGLVRAEDSNAVFELPKGEVPQSAYNLLSFMNEQRKERGGSAVGMANTANAAVGQGGDHTMERVMSSMELTNSLIARSMGETVIRGLFIELHKIIRENHQGELQARIGSRWVKSMPSEWQTRANVSIQIGSSNAERVRQANVLREALQVQEKLQAMGSVMFDEAKAYTAISQIMKLEGIKAPELFFTDPESEEGKTASKAKQQQSQEQQQKDAMVQEAMAKAQSDMAAGELMKGQAALQSQEAKVKIEGMRQELERMQAMVDAADKADSTQYKYDKLASDEALELTRLDLEYKEDSRKINEENA
jgi:hypothetical protein